MATQDDTAAKATAALELTRDEAQLLVKALYMARNGRRFEFRTGASKDIQEQDSFVAAVDALDSRLRAAFGL